MILRHYLDIENGDYYRALGRYNGSLGRPEYPNAVMAATRRHFADAPTALTATANAATPAPQVNHAPPRALPYRGRFAPSPTGPLHFGSLVAALASHADARAAGGEWLVRVEDVDAPRTRAGAESDIMATLARYGFAPDGPVVRQSLAMRCMRTRVARLERAGAVYACTCSRARTRIGAAGFRRRARLSRHLPRQGSAPGTRSAPCAADARR